MQNLSALFLDRDGVINQKIDDDYVRNLSQFEWLPGTLDAIVQLGKFFRYVIVVTNQQGVGKGLMSVSDVTGIHNHIIQKVQEAGGHLDRIYFCPSLKQNNDPNRKPGIGMGLQAKHDFPDIDFSRSLMIGDSASDMDFAERLGMQRIFLTHCSHSGATAIPGNASTYCRSLAEVPLVLPKLRF